MPVTPDGIAPGIMQVDCPLFTMNYAQAAKRTIKLGPTHRFSIHPMYDAKKTDCSTYSAPTAKVMIEGEPIL